MEQSRKQNRDYMNMLYGDNAPSADSTGVTAQEYQYNNGFIDNSGQAMDSQGNPVQRINSQGMPINEFGEVDVEAYMRSQGANVNPMPNTYDSVPLTGSNSTYGDYGYGGSNSRTMQPPPGMQRGTGRLGNPTEDPESSYSYPSYNNGRYDPQSAAYVQQMIRQMFGGR